ncbi:MAG: UDP-2,3-diacylglucosamine diphosphatase LpxI [Chitinispirillia bacterium]|nr:UDP-2,3-diacylglucosamine diphosphatase LpxI [Chitinispirillia bacterium]MCL2241623.1 UDP-2,3-diacylglucosamine diphosphatase LpxI [Chitinispirillia bacterium]
MPNANTGAPIGLIAGNRRLPFQFAVWAKRNGRELFIAGIKGETDSRLKEEVDTAHYHDFYITSVSKIIRHFKKKGVREVVMIGGIAQAKLRPSLDVAKIAARLLFMKNRHKGVFTIILSMFDRRGVRVRSIQELMPELLIGEGPLGKTAPAAADIAAFDKNLGTILDYARTGEGQAVIIHNGEILAFENIKGTDDLAKRATEKRRMAGEGSGGFMAKIMEPGQDDRADLPVVGTGTVETIAKYGLSGVFIEAGRTIADDVADTIELADRLGIFVYGVKLPE